MAYNKGSYLDYQASCYRGQSSNTCFIQPNRSADDALALLQDLSGTRLVRAPRWSGFVRSSDIPFTGSTPGAAPVGVLGDTGAVPSRGREIMIRLSLRFGS